MKYRTKALSELALPFLDPVVRKSSGLSVEIINNWVKIVINRLSCKVFVCIF